MKDEDGEEHKVSVKTPIYTMLDGNKGDQVGDDYFYPYDEWSTMQQLGIDFW